MARMIRTEIEIAASPERVWQILTDFGSYPEWNPFIRSVKGKACRCARLVARIQPPGSKGITMRPTIIRIDPNHQLRWYGCLWLPWLFDGEHVFTIEPIDSGKVRFIHCERFTGVLVPFVWKSLNNGTRKGFEEMNQALKSRAEQ